MGECLPVAIVGVTDRCKEEEDYILKDGEWERVKEFYESFGFTDVTLRRVEPSLGFTRDEVRAELPDGWSVEANGHYWIKYLDRDGVQQFSVFWKGAPWDYCTFVRR